MQKVPSPAEEELAYIQAMSRPSVVTAYAEWTATSEAEEMCLAKAVRPGMNVLDLGCGAGRFAARLGADVSKYVGVDASEEMLAEARLRFPHLSFVCDDILNLDLRPASYDLILLMGNVMDYLHPFERRTKLLARCSEWLRTGGHVIGSSHLSPPSSAAGYFAEDYHGANVNNYRAPLSAVVEEVELSGLEVILACRDYRYAQADWSYWLATHRA